MPLWVQLRDKHVIRENSDPGDIIILLGGRTGRDGIGGATGSSKVHTEASIEVCGAEVQKGNAPTERKIQRMFRRRKKSATSSKNVMTLVQAVYPLPSVSWQTDFAIDLDKVPKKYAGLDGTEIAISESQERMAVVVDPKDVDRIPWHMQTKKTWKQSRLQSLPKSRDLS